LRERRPNPSNASELLNADGENACRTPSVDYGQKTASIDHRNSTKVSKTARHPRCRKFTYRRTFDFVFARVLMKSLKTSSINIIDECYEMFDLKYISQLM